METKIVSDMMLTLLLIGTLTLAFNIQTVEASGTIYIRADGSVEGTTDISTVDNVTYTFTDNIYDEIVVERDNIVVDGAGYTLQGTGSGTGIHLTERSNVTIKNIEIKSFYVGIHLESSSNGSISGNNIINNGNGILLFSSSNNSICENNITNCTRLAMGVILFSRNNVIYHNNFINNAGEINCPNCNAPMFVTLDARFTNATCAYCNFTFVIETFPRTVEIGGIDDVNVWDDSAKGNYWSDYEERYPNATEIDGIWDTPYVIDENNQDNCPIVPEFPSFLFLPLFMIATLLAVIVYRKEHSI